MKESGVNLRIAGIVRESIVDGPGIRLAVFSQGCPHHCKGCHNTQTHDFSLGFECDINKIITEVDKNPLLAGVTFTGGEPFCQAEAFYQLGVLVKERGLNIVAYSGYTYEELNEMAVGDESIKRLLGIVDILIDGPFIAEQKDLTLEFRGSKNQRIIKKAEMRA